MEAGCAKTSTRPRMRREWRIAGLGAAILLSAAPVVCLLARGNTIAAGAAAFGVGVIAISAAAVVRGATAIRRHREHLRALGELEQVLGEIRQGAAPIEELGRFEGRFPRLTAELQELLRNLRGQRAQIAELNREMGQRVAQRTDALERLIGSLRLQASRDALTGLYNRRLLDELLGRALEQAAAEGRDLCLVMLDLDNFKLLNDTLGHVAGDAFLRDLGQLIRSTAQEDTLAFRYGGDEFALILPDGGRPAGLALARRLVDLTDALSRPLRLSPSVGLSTGIASLSEHPNARPQELLAAADRGLYHIKDQRKQADMIADQAAAKKSPRVTRGLVC